MITSEMPTTTAGYDVIELQSDALTDAEAIREFDGWCVQHNAQRSKVDAADEHAEPTSSIKAQHSAIAYPAGTTAIQGNHIYEQKVLPRLDSHDIGKMVAIDCESRDFIVAVGALDASQRVGLLHPNARVFLKRVGY